MDPPDRPELARFLERYTAALANGDAVEDAVSGGGAGAAVGFGLDLGRLQAAAFRRALPPGAQVHLPVLIRYRLPAHLEVLLATFPDPAARASTSRELLLRALVTIKDAKSTTWQVRERKADYDALYDALNRVLTNVAEAARPVEALARLEERAADAHAGETEDGLVACPLAGEPVSLRFSCASCVWAGPALATCYAPEARRYLEGLRVAGMTDRAALAGAGA